MGQCLYRRNLTHDMMESQNKQYESSTSDGSQSEENLAEDVSKIMLVLPSFSEKTLSSAKESLALDVFKGFSSDTLTIGSGAKSSRTQSHTILSLASLSTMQSSDSKPSVCLWRVRRLSHNSQQIYGNRHDSNYRRIHSQRVSRSKSQSWHRNPLVRGFSRDLNLNGPFSSSSIVRIRRASSQLCEREQPQLTVPKFIAGERIGESDSGKLTLKEPLRLLSNSFSCSLRLTDTCFELLYDQSDPMYPANAATPNKTKNKTQHRSNKVWMSGSVTPETNAFTLHPSKLIVSICGVEHGLSRKPGGLLRTRFPRSRDRISGSVSIILENCKIENSHVSTSSVQSLTSYWFASEGFFLNSTCKTAKDCFLEMITKLLKHNMYIAELLWEFLPESMFKDRAEPTISADNKNQPIVQQDSFFKSFKVVPMSQNRLIVSEINLAVCVFSKTDGGSSCIFLSELNGPFVCAETIVPPISSIDSFSTQKICAISIRSQTPVLDSAQKKHVKNEPHLSNVKYSENKPNNFSVAMSRSKIWASELNEFEDRIKVAILDAISSEENGCRSSKVDETEGDFLKSSYPQSLEVQGRNEKIMSRMTVVLRSENFHPADQFLSSDLQTESNDYNDEEQPLEKDVYCRPVFLGVGPKLDSSSLSPITTESLRAIQTVH